ncbi:FecR family protein [Marinifilum fragile]|uniref:FecR family protein n=1 Tax=Marinifilum fragile TaxID=570161 RepID=UPI0009F8E216|nr:FecR family protein [Marinifilum fragile]
MKKKMTSKEDILHDVLDYLNGKASDDQTKNLKEWLVDSDENKERYREIVRAYYRLGNIQNWDQINVLSAKRRINSKITGKKRIVQWSVAASIALLLGLGLTFLVNNFTQEQKLAQVTRIEPGQKGAELILSNGKKYQVMNTQKVLKEKDGSTLQIDTLKGIVYNKDAAKSKELIYNTIKVARGQEFNLQLADGTKVWLNADSELKYPVQFTGKSRKVYLKGEGYFEVAHNRQKAFIVNSFDQDLRVYGTKFNVNAYDKRLIKTVLVEGSIGVKIAERTEEKRMKAGDLLNANTVEGNMTTEQVDVYPYIAWKDGNFLFNNESLEEIMLRLERWYNVKVFFADNSARDIQFIGDMKRYTEINKLLYFIEKSSGVKFEVKEDVVIVSRK